MGVVYLLRHGETEMTLNHFFCGVSDPPLCEVGHQTAERAVKKIANVPFDKAICSPQRRCRETLEHLTREYEIDPDLIEINYGEYEGKSLKGIFSEDPKEPVHLLDIVENYIYPGGDDMKEYFYKAAAKVKRMIDEEEGNILACSHAGFMGSVVGGIFMGGVDTMFALRIPPCGILKLWKDAGEYHYQML